MPKNCVLAVALVAPLCGLAFASSAGAQAQQNELTLSVSDSSKVQPLRYDHRRGAETVSVSLAVLPRPTASDAPPVPVASVRGDFLSEENRRIARNRVKVSTPTWDGIDSFAAVIEVDLPDNAKPGRYTGIIVFGGPEYTQTALVTVVATVKSALWVGICFTLLGFLVGVAIKAVTDIFKTPGVRLSRTSLSNYTNRGGFVTAVVLGLFGAIAGWWIVYFDNPVWGANNLDSVRLWGSAVAGVVTGTTVADFFSPYKPPAS